MSESLLFNGFTNFSQWRKAEAAPLGIIIVLAFVYLIALGATIWAGMSIYCMSRGMNLDTGFGWGWVNFSDIRFKCYK